MELRSKAPRRRPTLRATLRVAALALPLAAVPAACTSHGGSEPVIDGGPGSEQEPPVATATPNPSAHNLPAWRWIHRQAEGGWFADIGPKVIQSGAVTCTFAHDDQSHDAGTLCCDGSIRRWCTDMREDFMPGISLASDGQLLFVADFPAISSGARFAAFQLETGALVWSRDALAIGPQAHSEYFNVVQLRRIDDTLIAYGDEAHGAYVEVMDPLTGALREHAMLDRPVVEWRWDDAAPEPEPTTTIELSGGGRCRFEADEREQATLQCEPVAAPAWSLNVDADFVGRGALLDDGQRIVLVSWSRIANGARARAWSLADGALLWDRAIEGIGPQDHSKYSNLIQIERADELLIVRGREAHGRYVEALALATGELRWTVSWPAF